MIGTRQLTTLALALGYLTTACGEDDSPGGGTGGGAGAAASAGKGTSGTGGGPGGSGGDPTFGEPMTLLDALNDPQGLALDDDWVYVTVEGLGDADGQVVRVMKDGSASEILVSGRAHPRGLCLDGDTVYWTESSASAGSVYSLAPGGAPKLVQKGTVALNSVLVDDENVYVGTRFDGTASHVSWQPKAGGAPTTADATFQGDVELARSPSRGWLLALDSGSSASTVTAIDLADGHVVNTASAGLAGMSSGVVEDDAALVVALPNDGRIAGAVLDEASSADDWPVYLDLEGLSEPWGVAQNSRYLVYTERDHCAAGGNGKVGAIPKANNWDGRPISFASGIECPTRLAIDEDNGIYLLTSGGDTAGGALVGGTVLKLSSAQK